MPYVDWYFKEDDERPDISDTLEDQQGNAIDLSNASAVHFHVRHESTDTLVVSEQATIETAADGEVSFAFSDGQLDTAGYHAAEWEIAWNDGDEQTIPPNRDLGIQVGESVEGDGNLTAPDLETTGTVTTVTSAYTASDGEAVLVDASGGAVTVTLPGPTSGQTVAIKKIDSSGNAATIATPGSETIDGQSSLDVTAQYASRTITTDGSNYYII